jgi:hypothetical protein
MTSGAASLSGSEALTAEIESEFPDFRVVFKVDSPLSKAIDIALRIITLGAQRRFMSHYHTVIGSTLYVSPLWTGMSDVERTILLRHERVHLRQRRRYGLPLFVFLYLVPVLPLGLAYGRARLEWEAYRETLRATHELKGSGALADAALRREIVRRFVGGDYGWMWPFPRAVERWFDRAVEELATESGPKG